MMVMKKGYIYCFYASFLLMVYFPKITVSGQISTVFPQKCPQNKFADLRPFSCMAASLNQIGYK